jgi:phage tail-like protein
MKSLLAKILKEVHADSGQTFASTDRHDPYRNFNYSVEITGKKTFAKAGYQKVTGLKVKTDVIEYREGSDKQLTPHKLTGLTKYDPVTFERGMSEDSDMIDWIFQQINEANDDTHKVTVKVILKDRGTGNVKSWELLEAWISDYETGDFDAQGNGVAIDRMVVQHEGIKFNGKTIQ